MKIKNGFVLRTVCGENVIVGEGLDAINFGRMLSLNETAAWLWKQAMETGSGAERFYCPESLGSSLSGV